MEWKTSIPIIKVIRPKNMGRTDAEVHLQDVVRKMRREDGFAHVKGYALMTFHEDGSYASAQHISDMKIKGFDFPDMVRERMKRWYRANNSDHD